jgi:RNA polymerase sigma-70 factor (ECF subfamily)
MATTQPKLVAPSSSEELQLAPEGDTESIAIPLRASPTSFRSTAADRRHERRWIRDAQRGSGEALEALYRRHWPWAHRAAYLVVHDKAAAEDIAQEAFLAAVRGLDRFDRRRPFGPWLHRIVVNRAIDWARARSLRPEAAITSEPDADAGSEVGPRAPERSRPYSDSVVVALASLSPEHRAVVVLRYLLEYTPGEIAEALELPRGTVNSRLRRALDRLGKLLEGER